MNRYNLVYLAMNNLPMFSNGYIKRNGSLLEISKDKSKTPIDEQQFYCQRAINTFAELFGYKVSSKTNVFFNNFHYSSYQIGVRNLVFEQIQQLDYKQAIREYVKRVDLLVLDKRNDEEFIKNNSRDWLDTIITLQEQMFGKPSVSTCQAIPYNQQINERVISHINTNDYAFVVLKYNNYFAYDYDKQTQGDMLYVCVPIGTGIYTMNDLLKDYKKTKELMTKFVEDTITQVKTKLCID